MVCVPETWAPKGLTPVVTHPYHWKKVSVAGALAYRWDGRRCRLVFQTKPDSYNSQALIRFLRTLRRHFRGRKLILVWDRLNAHKSREMAGYLASQRRWLRIEWLPPYAPDLNPVETLWETSRGRRSPISRCTRHSTWSRACVPACAALDTRTWASPSSSTLGSRLTNALLYYARLNRTSRPFAVIRRLAPATAA